MSKTGYMQARIEPEVKEQAEKIFKQIGLNATDAINIFYHQVINYNGIPFELRIPNDETLQAMKETEEIIQKGESRFSSVEEMFKELKS